ncbi:MAG: hypothetical protein EOO11_06925, partial [Chitinophagaceae bacterium]
MQTRSRTLRNLLILQAVFLVACKKNDGFGPTEGVSNDTTTALKEAADFPIGVAISQGPILNNAQYRELVKRDFDAVTFDYHMKHGAIVKGDGSLDFTQADAMVNALGSGVGIFGHTLGWHSNQNAAYLKNYSGLLASLGAEQLSNPGFESALTSWGVWNTGDPAGTSSITANTDPANVRGGSGSAKVHNPSGYPGNQWRVQLASPIFNTTVGKQYTISYWVKAVSAGGSIRISTMDQNFGNAQYQGDETIGASWQQVTWTITASTAQTRFLFDLGQAANTYYIDDVSFKEVLPPLSGPITALKLDTALGKFVTGMVDHYKSRVHAWDVVNELFADDGAIRNNTNTTVAASDVFVWSNYMGRDFAYKAFQYARAADPAADLY